MLEHRHTGAYDRTVTDDDWWTDLVPERIVLDPEAYDAFVAVLDEPPQFSQALYDLMHRPDRFEQKES